MTKKDKKKSTQPAAAATGKQKQRNTDHHKPAAPTRRNKREKAIDEAELVARQFARDYAPKTTPPPPPSTLADDVEKLPPIPTAPRPPAAEPPQRPPRQPKPDRRVNNNNNNRQSTADDDDLPFQPRTIRGLFSIDQEHCRVGAYARDFFRHMGYTAKRRFSDMLDPPNAAVKYHNARLVHTGYLRQVFSACRAGDNRKVVVIESTYLLVVDEKLVSVCSPVFLLQILNEVRCLRQLANHRNCIRSYSCSFANPTLTVVAEYCIASVMDVLVLLDESLEDDEIGAICSGVLSALVYMHSIGWMHRNIKLSSILLTDRAVVKLAGFTCACPIAAPIDILDEPWLSGEFTWRAPEMRKGREYAERVDIWSLGITCCVLGDNKLPYTAEERHKGQLAPFIAIDGDRPESYRPTYNRMCEWNDALLSFVELCLQDRRTQRPSAATMLEHEFVKSVRDTTHHCAVVIGNLIERSRWHAEMCWYDDFNDEEEKTRLRIARRTFQVRLASGEPWTPIDYEPSIGFDGYPLLSVAALVKPKAILVAAIALVWLTCYGSLQLLGA